MERYVCPEGELKQFKANIVVGGAPVHLQIWRPLGNNTFSLVAEQIVMGSDPGVYVINVSSPVSSRLDNFKHK